MFLYAIPRPVDQVIVGENFKRGILDEFHLGHLELKTIRDASVGEASLPGLGVCTLIAPRPVHGQAGNAQATPDHDWQTIDLAHGRHLGIGYVTIPTPQDLQRSRQLIGGVPIVDDAGREWMVPIARSPRNRATLPTAILVSADGSIERIRKPSADWIWELSGEVWDAWNNGDDKIDDAWLVRTAIEILSANYRISWIEINALAHAGACLLDDVKAAAACLAFIDFDHVRESAAGEESKKKDSAPTESNS